MAVIHTVDPNIGPKENFMKMLYTAFPKLTMSYDELVERVEMYYLDPNSTTSTTWRDVRRPASSISDEYSFFTNVFKYDSTTKTYSCRIMLKGRPAKGVYGSKIINLTNITRPFAELDNTVTRPVYTGSNTNPIKKIFKVGIPNTVLTGTTTEASSAYSAWLSTTEGNKHILEVFQWLCDYAGIPKWMHRYFGIDFSTPQVALYVYTGTSSASAWAVIHENKFVWNGKTHAILRIMPRYNNATVNTPSDIWASNPAQEHGITFFSFPNNVQNLSYGQSGDATEMFVLLEGIE